MAALSEEQSIVRAQASSWVAERAPVQAFRVLRDSSASLCYDPDVWKQMVELGWTGSLIPETYGGSGLGYFTFGLILEQLGRELTASPLFASSFVGATAIMAAGDEAARQAYLPAIVKGDSILSLAIDEGPHHAPFQVALKAERTNRGYRLNGVKTFVFDGMAATEYVVVARTAGAPGERDGISMFVVPASSDGLARKAMRTIDSRGYAQLTLSDVIVGEEALLGRQDQSADALEQILQCAAAGIAVEMMGTASRAFDMTLDYLKTREQFGRVIGSFQALGHRAAALFSAQELSRSCVEAALQAIDDRSPEQAELCALAKAKMGDFLFDMSNQLIQIHGGIGMTDEFDAGLYLKRARVLEPAFGNRAFHRQRYATLLGY